MPIIVRDQIFYLDEFMSINSSMFNDCVIHILCKDGNGSFKYNGTTIHLIKNDLAVISNPEGNSDIESDKDFKCDILIAPEKFLHALLPANNYSIVGRVSLFSNPVIRMSQEDAEVLRSDIQIIVQRSKDVCHKYYNELLGSLFRAFIYDIFNLHSRQNENPFMSERVSYVTKRFFAMIQDGLPAIRREPSYYADKLNVSVKYLSETIKRVSGDSVSRHINRAAISIILDYLKDDSLSITQISDAMHFSSVQYFSRYCVKHLGKSPAHFRS